MTPAGCHASKMLDVLEVKHQDIGTDSVRDASQASKDMHENVFIMLDKLKALLLWRELPIVLLPPSIRRIPRRLFRTKLTLSYYSSSINVPQSLFTSKECIKMQASSSDASISSVCAPLLNFRVLSYIFSCCPWSTCFSAAPLLLPPKLCHMCLWSICQWVLVVLTLGSQQVSLNDHLNATTSHLLGFFVLFLRNAASGRPFSLDPIT